MTVHSISKARKGGDVLPKQRPESVIGSPEREAMYEANGITPDGEYATEAE